MVLLLCEGLLGHHEHAQSLPGHVAALQGTKRSVGSYAHAPADPRGQRRRQVRERLSPRTMVPRAKLLAGARRGKLEVEPSTHGSSLANTECSKAQTHAQGYTQAWLAGSVGKPGCAWVSHHLPWRCSRCSREQPPPMGATRHFNRLDVPACNPTRKTPWPAVHLCAEPGPVGV